MVPSRYGLSARLTLTRRHLPTRATAGAGILAAGIPRRVTGAAATLHPDERLSDDVLINLWERAGLIVAVPGSGDVPAPLIAFPTLGNPISHSLVHLETGEPFPNFGVLYPLQNAENNGRNSYRFAAQVLYMGYSVVEVATSDGPMAGVVLHGLMFWGDPRYGTLIQHQVDFALWWKDNGTFAAYPPYFTLQALGEQRPISRVGEGGGAGTPVDQILEALEPHRSHVLLELAVGGAWEYSLDYIAITDEMDFPTDLFEPASLEETSEITGELHRTIDAITLEMARGQGFGLRPAGTEAIEAITDAHINAVAVNTLEGRLAALPSAASEPSVTLEAYNDLPLVTEIRGHTIT